MTENWKLKPFAGFSRHYWNEKVSQDSTNQVTWVKRWYSPGDLRVKAPVQARKFPTQVTPDISTVPSHWIPQPEPPLRAFSRMHEETTVYPSSPSTRCESWSTLRQMLPSRGFPQRHLPAKWGTDTSIPPTWMSAKQKRFPHINNPMTNYVDDIHVNNPLFRLH